VTDKAVTHWIDNKAWDGASERRGPLFDPAVGRQTGTVDLAGPAEVDQAVAGAAAAFPAWRDTSLTRRAAVLFSLRELVRSHDRELAQLITSEHGKVLADARGEVARGLEVIEFACGIPHLLKGEHSEEVSTGVDAHSARHPVGVAAGITPFNFPVMVPLWMAPIALACGNCFVLKPSERDPSASVRLAELAAEAGVPPGVLQVVQGDKVAVDALLSHPGIAAVSFVGATPTARHVYEEAARHGKRVQALGGAKNHLVVMPDADMDAAAAAAVSSAYGSAGERCMAVSALVAVGGAGDELVPRIAERAAGLRVGPGTEPGMDMGPLVTGPHRDRVTSYLEAGVAAGATLAVDGRGHRVEGDPGGYWLGPCLFDHVTPAMSIYTDEIFGPVLSTLRVDTLDDALGLLRANPYGNGAAIFTNDGRAVRTFEREADAGMIGVNVPIPVPMAYYSFGGWKTSLFGDLHVYGADGVAFYTRTKAVVSRFDRGADQAGLGFPTAT
jgi:malonate-semialdehyde dehydrogenase (acetylating)/methylmalonate-semialdehyde dehydrogenase